MFRDRNKELKNLEEALLQEEEVFRESDDAEMLDEIARLVAEEQAPKAEVPEAPKAPPKRSRARAKKENLRPLIISAVLMSLAILGILAFWVLRFIP